MSRILIIEDEEAIAELEKDYLELSGFEVIICNKLAWAKWLGHVIVSPKSKTADLVNIIFLRGNHNDRSILSFSYLAADFKPVYLRQHQIQNNQVKIFFQCHIKPQIASVADYNFKS